MINQLKTAFFSTLRNTTTSQFLSVCSRKTISAFKRYAPIDSARQKIDFFKTTIKLMQEHKTVAQNTQAPIYSAVEKDLKPIQEFAILLANDILI